MSFLEIVTMVKDYFLDCSLPNFIYWLLLFVIAYPIIALNAKYKLLTHRYLRLFDSLYEVTQQEIEKRKIDNE